MKLFLLNLICFIWLTIFVKKSHAIIGGTSVTTLPPYGYTCSVQCPAIMCNCALIKENYVLTTATCVKGLLPSDVTIVLGSVQYFDPKVQRVSTSITPHPNFDSTTYVNNLAVVGIDAITPTEMSTYSIVVIPLATTPVVTGNTLTATSFGAIDTAKTLPDYMQKGTLFTVWSATTCQTYRGVTAATSFCAGGSSGKPDCCAADQGAPAVMNNKLYGIYSNGGQCGSGSPALDVFVNIGQPAVNSWITSTAV